MPQSTRPPEGPADSLPVPSAGATLEAMERDMILQALARAGNNK
ncbi:MAG TPA: hypothetical protein VFW45_01500 [Candidatus Polarisedimenticolia bacterium]|nr:hypothetical protein [Candidatus Polarisedimenticolia bacterium]